MTIKPNNLAPLPTSPISQQELDAFGDHITNLSCLSPEPSLIARYFYPNYRPYIIVFVFAAFDTARTYSIQIARRDPNSIINTPLASLNLAPLMSDPFFVSRLADAFATGEIELFIERHDLK